MLIFAPHAKDFYKVGHKPQYAVGTDFVYSNLTARSGKHSNIPDGKGIVLVGVQYVMIDTFINDWNETFFSQPKQNIMAFWEYDQYPFLLCGEIELFRDDGKVRVINYGGAIFKPKFILPYGVGLELSECLTILKNRHIKSLENLKIASQNEINALIGKYVGTL